MYLPTNFIIWILSRPLSIDLSSHSGSYFSASFHTIIFFFFTGCQIVRILLCWVCVFVCIQYFCILANILRLCSRMQLIYSETVWSIKAYSLSFIRWNLIASNLGIIFPTPEAKGFSIFYLMPRELWGFPTLTGGNMHFLHCCVSCGNWSLCCFQVALFLLQQVSSHTCDDQSAADPHRDHSEDSKALSSVLCSVPHTSYLGLRGLQETAGLNLETQKTCR